MSKPALDFSSLFYVATIAARGNPVVAISLFRSFIEVSSSHQQYYQKFSGGYGASRSQPDFAALTKR